MNNYAIVIVLYYPDSDAITHLLELIRAEFSIILVDNTFPPVILNVEESDTLKIIRNNRNIGLATALNKGIETAIQNGFQNAFLLDQDTRLPSNYFSEMIQFKNYADGKQNNYALYVPDCFDRNSGSKAKFPVLGKFQFRHFVCGSRNIALKRKAIIAITSGSLIDLDKHQYIGPMQDEYFIDFLDNEYCLRLSTKGFEVAVNCGLTLDHAIGRRAKHTILGIEIKPNHHQPARRYYISRNGVVTAIRYFRPFKAYTVLIVLRLMHEYLSIILFEDRKILKLWASCCGVIDGFMNRMGPFRRHL